ncbi:prepilin peptidase [Lichenicoccus roseus]|uniref:Prepilin leader peptidase/N-methyltransferase n=1 Tax=Lichenicoccus roseus TaxID=2683649 RepID=A0A5R9JBK7_9PROT|nr:A24 family peptidase [Lichenicoccus roseus]TLU71658.1 prepilin peptidase [Lichenicoccus roseus]
MPRILALLSESFLALLVSPAIGSFLGVLVRRLPSGRPVALARSGCEHCGRVLGAAELLPLVSYAWQRGRCVGCGAPIGWFHPAIELAALAVAVVMVPAAGGDGLTLWAGCGLGWTCLTLALIDLQHQRLPDILTLPLLLAGLGVCALGTPDRLASNALAACLGWLGFRAIALLYRRLRGIEGLGQGDAKLLAAAGAWVGLAMLPLVMGGGAFLTLLWVLGEAAWRRRMPPPQRRLPFGPGLAAACFAVWLLTAT